MYMNSTGIVMYANLRNCTSLYRSFMFSILHIMDIRILLHTLKFATAKKYGDLGSVKAGSFLSLLLLFSVSVNN